MMTTVACLTSSEDTHCISTVIRRRQRQTAIDDDPRRFCFLVDAAPPGINKLTFRWWGPARGAVGPAPLPSTTLRLPWPSQQGVMRAGVHIESLR